MAYFDLILSLGKARCSFLQNSFIFSKFRHYAPKVSFYTMHITASNITRQDLYSYLHDYHYKCILCALLFAIDFVSHGVPLLFLSGSNLLHHLVHFYSFSSHNF